jgi:hypothetical protein
MGERIRGLRSARWMVALGLVMVASTATAENCRFYVRAGFVPIEGVADGRSPQTAYGTIAAGVRAAQNAGDVVCVGPGLYVEGDITLVWDGLATAPITVRGDSTGASTGDAPGSVRIIPPTDLPADQTPGTGFLLLGRHDVIIEGFDISGFRDAGIQVRSSVPGVGAVLAVNSLDITIRQNSIHGCRTGIDIHGGGIMVTEGNITVGNSSSGISIESCDATDLFGFCRAAPSGPVVPIISNNRSGGNGAHGIIVQRGADAVVQNNVLYKNAFTGLSVRGVADALIANNLIYANGDEGLAVGSGFFEPGMTGSATDFASPNVIVLNNTLYQNGEWGVEIGNALGASPGGAVVNNLVWGNGEGRLGIGVLNERGGDTPMRESSVCGYVAGFNGVGDEYGPDTPRNTYDLHDDPLFADVAGPDGILGGEFGSIFFIDRSGDDDFRLPIGSPARDAGATTASRLGLTGSATSAGDGDGGLVDLGYHYGANPEQVLFYEPPRMPLYVRASGNDADDGRTPATAFASIGTAGRRARAGVTVVVGPGTYRECNIHPPPYSGRAAFVADSGGAETGDAAGVVLVDAGKCFFDEGEGGGFVAGETGFNVANVCGVVIDGFHITGAFEDGVQVQNQCDGAVVRNVVAFNNLRRGINVVNSDDVRIANNLAFANGTGGFVLGSGSRPADQCAEAGARRAQLEFNTAYGHPFDGFLIGSGQCPSTDATLRYNVTGGNGRAGIEVGNDQTRAANLVGYRSEFNLVADRFATGVPHSASDLLIDLAFEPLYIDPTAIAVEGDWRADQHFRLVQHAAGQATQSRAIDFANISALKAGMSTFSTRTDGQPDVGMVDLGYHYPSGVQRVAADCNADGATTINEVIVAVNIALGNFAMETCSAADANADGLVGISDLITAVNAVLGE